MALDSPEPLRKRRRFSCFSVGGNRDKCEDDVAIPRRTTRSSLPRTDLSKCLICRRDKPQPINRRLPERLARCECDSTPATLCHAAQVCEDELVLLEIDQYDHWAKDFLYHRSSYLAYVHLEHLNKKSMKI